MAAAISAFLSSLLRAPLSWREPPRIHAVAAPGLITLLDVALYRTNEGGITSTTCATSVALRTFLELKAQASTLLREVLISAGEEDEENEEDEDNTRKSGSAGEMHGTRESAESFARLCLECTSEAIERLTTDRLAQSANPPSDTGGSGSAGVGSSSGSGAVGGGPTPQSPSSAAMAGMVGISSPAGVTEDDAGGIDAVREGVIESARCSAVNREGLRRRDCWESPRLYCPDYVWADDAISACQRLVRLMAKHRFASAAAAAQAGALAGVDASEAAKWGVGGWSRCLPSDCVDVAEKMWGLIRDDLPSRLHQLRAAVEANAVVSKRLYLVKCEYRAPFRAFLEAHDAVRRAPRVELVDAYLELHRNGDSEGLKKRKEEAELRIKKVKEDPGLVEALNLEQQCEMMEVGMATMLFPFANLARLIDSGKVQLKEFSDILSEAEIVELHELLRRLKSILCRSKSGPGTSTGIRPLLLDLQGVPRDSTLKSSEINPFGSIPRTRSDEEAIKLRLNKLLSQLQCLRDMWRIKGSFGVDRRDSGLIASLQKGCASLDDEMFCAQYLDWYNMVKRQREIVSSSQFQELSETMRRAEIEVSIAIAPQSALDVARKRLDAYEKDRTKRFDVLKEMVQEVCLREMNLQLELSPPDKDVVLELPHTSALGLFGLQLQMAGEILPIG